MGDDEVVKMNGDKKEKHNSFKYPYVCLCASLCRGSDLHQCVWVTQLI